MLSKKIEKKMQTQDCEPIEEQEIERLIKKGGSAPQDEIKKKELVFNLRMSFQIAEKIDKDRKLQGGFVSRNTWILQAIQEKLNNHSSE